MTFATLVANAIMTGIMVALIFALVKEIRNNQHKIE